MSIEFKCSDCGHILKKWYGYKAFCECGIPNNIVISGYTPKPKELPIDKKPLLQEDLPAPIVEIKEKEGYILINQPPAKVPMSWLKPINNISSEKLKDKEHSIPIKRKRRCF